MAFYMVETQLTELGLRPLEIALELGFPPVLVTNDPDRYARLHAYRRLAQRGTRVLAADTNDTKSVIQAVERDGDPVQAVFTICDYNLVVAAEACQYFGLPSLSADAARTATNKLLCRRRLEDQAISVPRFVNAVRPGELAAAVSSTGLPCVVKPMTDSASVGVRLCHSLEHVRHQYEALVGERRNARGQERPPGVLIEEFVMGYEVSVESFFRPELDRHAVIGVTDKHLGGAPAFAEIGEEFPSLLPARIVEAVGRLACDALHAIGHRFGAAHTEIRVGPNGPAIIEVNARVGGDDISELVRLSTGVDILRAVVELACGLDTGLIPSPAPAGAAWRAVVPGQAGILRGVHGLELARRFEGVLEAEMHAETGTPVSSLVSNHEILGHVLVAAPTAAEAARIADAAVTQISLDIVP